MPATRCLSALLIAAFGFMAPPSWAQDDLGGAVDVAIVLAVDVSPSVNGTELAVQRGGYAIALRHPDLIAAIQAGAKGRIALSYFEWSRWVREASVVPWQVIETPEDLDGFAGAIAELPVITEHGTSISRALAHGIEMLESPGLEGARRVIDVSGDGPNTVGPPVTQIRNRAVDAGIIVNGLPILIQPSPTFPEIDRYYEDCVIGGFGSFLLTAQSTGDLAGAIRRKLILEISGLPAESRFRLAAGHEPVDCLVGEKQRKRFPGIAN